MDVYASPHEHLLAELERMEVLLQACVARFRNESAPGAELRGLFIGDSEVDEILARAPGESAWPPMAAGDALPARWAQITRQLAARALASERAGIHLPLRELQRRFDLSPFELDVVVLALAPELDLRYERLYAYLQDDMTRKRPTVGFLLDLLCAGAPEKWARRDRFSLHSTLRRSCLLDVFADRAGDNAPLLRHFVRPHERVVGYLLGHDALEPELSELLRVLVPSVHMDEVVAPARTKTRLQDALQGAQARNATGRGLLVHLQGESGVGRRLLAEAACGELGKQLLLVDAARFSRLGQEAAERSLALVLREARLRDAGICWTGCDALREAGAEPIRDLLFAPGWEYPGPHFFIGEGPWQLDGALAARPLLRLRLDRPDLEARCELWHAALPTPALAEEAHIQEVAARFQMSGRQIRNAARSARNGALSRGNGDTLSLDDLIAGCREQANIKLRELARKITPVYTWDDIVLPADLKDQLRELCNFVRYRSVVFDDWGFGRKLSLGKGLAAIFAGPSGTGKTMAAEIVGHELHLDLYKIDLSSVVSKYIGDTEKNLARVFREAQDSQGILFFDEADALFGKRSQVQDAHDRYANIEVSHLLQELDQHEGIVILATNLMKNIDEAFLRRIAFRVAFPFPDVSDRERLWQTLWPRQLPRDSNVDVRFLARQFKLTGGQVKNVLVAAAFLAAADGRSVSMEHLVRGIKREYNKIGKPCVATDFGPWYAAVQGRAAQH